MKKFLVIPLLATLVMPITSFAGGKGSKSETAAKSGAIKLEDQIHLHRMYRSELERYAQATDAEKISLMEVFQNKLTTEQWYKKAARGTYVNRGKVAIGAAVTAVLVTAGVVVYLKRALIQQQIAKMKSKA